MQSDAKVEGNKWIMSWEEVERCIEALYQDIISHKSRSEDIKAIVGVGKGGIIPAALLWQKFPKASFHVVHMSTYTEEGKKGTPVLLTAVATGMQGPNVLVVDDICDSGDTFRHLQHYLPGAMYSSMLVRDLPPEKNPFEVDFMGEAVIDGIWVDFPWERQEAEIEVPF
jgi:xanthine phosphoribosyltransferase